MIYHEKSTIKLSAKLDITCDALHELIHNNTRQLITTSSLKLS
ncbi:MAG: hypothetical protein ACTS73_06430 [Arsenophonus sp. NEOnobi-MAG3]